MSADNSLLVSVIIPAYNSEPSLQQCLDSALGQSYPNMEVVLVNDGSTDGTDSIARSYHDKIIYINQINKGQGAARNRGLTEAKGEFVVFLDADDYWRPDFLKTTVDFLNIHSEAVAVSCGLCTRFNDGHEEIGPPCLADGSGPKEAIVLNDFYRFWAEQDHVRTGSALIRHKVIKKAGPQRADLRVSQDLEYWGYIATFGLWGFIPEPLWVGNSRSYARGFGWLRKYQKRRRLCPTVESWQDRILPRLSDQQMHNFRKVRGRVASGYAQNKIIGGKSREALHIVRKYGQDMPNNKLTRALHAGARSGPVGWLTACAIIRLKEYSKSLPQLFSDRF